MNPNFSQLKKEIIEIVSTTPGVQGFVNFDLENNDMDFSILKTRLEDSIFILETNKGLIVKIMIVINYKINVKTIIRSVDQAIAAVFKKTNHKFYYTDIYVRGVKR
ncbi:hypothetical protein NV226_02790 [Mycoplasma iguanae]|uniref:Asp23/Gls24 family envelope stress response protein n=1 Tax=Mycoplasma iguanae TaxID=292461 RepID=A0ABY5RBA3_9MOLU|nr:hypothetical protein [Mycoplasma iguanae]UVD81627.1 hypothetical protein NV226_02790 [Mycoplasma iguanae]